jgi:hypothetical protein
MRVIYQHIMIINAHSLEPLIYIGLETISQILMILNLLEDGQNHTKSSTVIKVCVEHQFL